MKDGTCPKCGSSNVIPELLLQGDTREPWVDMIEPDPPNRPFIWVPKSASSKFTAYICGNCGYTEFYAENYRELGEAHKKGFK